MADTADMFVCDDLPAIACLPAGEASYRCTGTGEIRHACRGTVSGPSPHVIFNFISQSSLSMPVSDFKYQMCSSIRVFREDMARMVTCTYVRRAICANFANITRVGSERGRNRDLRLA